MKPYLIITALICLCCFGFKEQNNCKKFRNGTFRILDTPRNYIITRQGDIQYEQLEGDTYRNKFFVKWLSDCVYTLKPGKEYLARHPYLTDTSLVTVTITSITDSSYVQTTSANYSDLKMSYEVFLIKN